MTINITPVDIAVDTFNSWVVRTNEIINAIAIHTITTGTDAATGNVAVVGSLSSNNIYARYLSGGSFSTTGDPSPTQANLTIVSNAIFTGAKTNLGPVANVIIQGGNGTHRVLTVNSNAGNTLYFDQVSLANDFADMDINNPANNDVLVYKTATGKWTNSSNAKFVSLEVDSLTINGNINIYAVNANDIYLTNFLYIANAYSYGNLVANTTSLSINYNHGGTNTTTRMLANSVSFVDYVALTNSYLSSNTLKIVSFTSNTTLTANSLQIINDSTGINFAVNSAGISLKNISNQNQFYSNGTVLQVGNNFNSVSMTVVPIPTVTVGNTMIGTTVNTSTVMISNTYGVNKQFIANTSQLYVGNTTGYFFSNSSTIFVGNTDVYFRANTTGIVSNSSIGYATVNTSQIATGNSSSNTFINATSMAILSPTYGLTVNSTAIYTGNTTYNTVIGVNGINIGNATVNAVANTTVLSIADPNSLTTDGGFYANSTSIFVGNSSVNFFANTSGIYKNNMLYPSAVDMICIAMSF